MKRLVFGLAAAVVGLASGCGNGEAPTGGAAGATAGTGGSGGTGGLTAGAGGATAGAGGVKTGAGGVAAGAGGVTAGAGGVAAGAGGVTAGAGGVTAGAGGVTAGAGGVTAGAGGVTAGAGGVTAGAGGSGGAVGGAGGTGGKVDGGADAGACIGVDGKGIFTAANAWTKDISCAPVHPSSKTITDTLAAAGGWGTGQTQFQIDMSLVVLKADATAPMNPFQKASGYYTPDCDDVASVPMPVGGNIEGAAAYTCDAANNDCHLLVVHQPTNKLYEVYQATKVGANLTGSCVTVWDLTKTYPDNMRGEQCTSADAAGFPMAAMLPDADEVASGAIMHAIRFALPNPRIRAGVYVHPASHAGGPTGGANLPPYGVRMRLRADYPVNNLPAGGARAIAKALQRFGMFLSDGGNVPLMIQDDRYTTAKWATLNVDSHSLYGITVSDFEIVEMGAPVTLTYNCVRNP